MVGVKGVEFRAFVAPFGGPVAMWSLLYDELTAERLGQEIPHLQRDSNRGTLGLYARGHTQLSGKWAFMLLISGIPGILLWTRGGT